jgi:hypothetical protein
MRYGAMKGGEELVRRVNEKHAQAEEKAHEEKRFHSNICFVLWLIMSAEWVVVILQQGGRWWALSAPLLASLMQPARIKLRDVIPLRCLYCMILLIAIVAGFTHHSK